MWRSFFQVHCAIFTLLHIACAGHQLCSILHELPEHISTNRDALLSQQRETTAIWSEAYSNKDVGTMMSFVRQDYIQHNPNIGSGRETAQKYITERLSTPDLVNNVTRVVSELNFVLLHVHRIQPGQKDRAMADIYRLDGTCIAEHWDVQQEMDSENPNPGAFF